LENVKGFTTGKGFFFTVRFIVCIPSSITMAAFLELAKAADLAATRLLILARRPKPLARPLIPWETPW